MRIDEPDILDRDEEWGHRRENLRHAVSIPALVTDRLGAGVQCIIEDISATGMLLTVDMAKAREIIADERHTELLKQGTTVDVAFAPDPETERVAVKAQVMWRAPVALGIRFLEQTPALRTALREIARQAVVARIDESERKRRELDPNQRRIMQACRKTVRKLLPNMIWAMRTELGTRLRLPSEHPDPQEAQAARAEADTLDAKAMAVTRTIEQQVLQGFSEASDLEQTQELTMAQLQSTRAGAKSSEAGMGVVHELALEHDTRISAVAHTIEERYKAKFFELNVRLANVLGHPLDTRTNPLVPGSMCRIFWQAVTIYCDSPRIQQALQQVMLHTVGPLLGELYEALNAVLDEHGAEQIFDVRQAHLHRPD
ncbi:MAG: DUF1631 family protein [Gammaproteobacteria bacterium]